MRAGTAQPHLAAGSPRSARCSAPTPALPFSSLRDAALVSAAPDPAALLHLLPVCCRPRASAESRRGSSHCSGRRSHGLSTGTGREAELRAARLGAGHEAKRSEIRGSRSNDAGPVLAPGKRPAAAAEGRNPARVTRVWGRATPKGCRRTPGKRRREPSPRVRYCPWQRERHRTAAGRVRAALGAGAAMESGRAVSAARGRSRCHRDLPRGDGTGTRGTTAPAGLVRGHGRLTLQKLSGQLRAELPAVRRDLCCGPAGLIPAPLPLFQHIRSPMPEPVALPAQHRCRVLCGAGPKRKPSLWDCVLLLLLLCTFHGPCFSAGLSEPTASPRDAPGAAIRAHVRTDTGSRLNPERCPGLPHAAATRASASGPAALPGQRCGCGCSAGSELCAQPPPWERLSASRGADCARHTSAACGAGGRLWRQNRKLKRLSHVSRCL